MARRVTVRELMGLVETTVERLDSITGTMAELMHPLATQHRYELAKRVQMLETRLAQSEGRVAALEGLVQRLLDGDGDGWKRDA